MKFNVTPARLPAFFCGETGYAEAMTDAGEAFSITRPPLPGAAGALVFGSPHSGAVYPDDMGAAADLSISSLRSAEDALMAQLVADGPRHGAPLIAGRFGRAYVDLNRDPEELDPALVEGAQGPAGAKTAAGYGVLPRLSGDGRPLYDRRLTAQEAKRRIETAHRPYHQALGELMQAARARHGRAVLIDWHSMPTRAAGVEVVLGDRHGSACQARLTRRLRDLFQAAGWRVSLNLPYAGGWSTQVWGRPEAGFEAIQIEISRGLYLDEATQRPNATFDLTHRKLSRVIAALCAEH